MYQLIIAMRCIQFAHLVNWNESVWESTSTIWISFFLSFYSVPINLLLQICLGHLVVRKKICYESSVFIRITNHELFPIEYDEFFDVYAFVFWVRTSLTQSPELPISLYCIIVLTFCIMSVSIEKGYKVCQTSDQNVLYSIVFNQTVIICC